MFPQPVRVTLDLDHDGMVQQAVKQGRGNDVVAEDSAPVLETAIGGEDDGAFLIAVVLSSNALAKRRPPLFLVTPRTTIRLPV